MKKALYCVFISILFLKCKPDFPNSQQIYVHAKFTDLKGAPVKEAASGTPLIISSEEFLKLDPNGISPNLAKLYFNNVQVPFQVVGPNAISTRVPLMLMFNYTNLNISIRYNFRTIHIIEVILYRPRVTAEVLAGNDGTFQMPAEMTIDAGGNLYVIDQRTDHDVIIKVTPDGTTSTFAGGTNEFGRLVGIGIDASTSKMYVSDATAQQVKWFNLSTPSVITVLAGSGTAGNVDGTGTAASFRFGTQRVDNFSSNELGQGLTVDPTGNVFVGEMYGTASSGYESQIRRITPGGVVTTVTGSRITMPMDGDDLHPVAGLTTLQPSNEPVYIGGSSSFYQGIARINTVGTQTRLAGKVSNENLNDGTGTAAEFAFPKAISYNAPYYHVADGTNGAYRRVTTTGTVTTVAGVGHFDTPSFCFCGIAGPATGTYIFPSVFDADPNKFEIAASAIIMDQVGGIAVRNNGLVYLSDYGTNFKCIWKIRIE